MPQQIEEEDDNGVRIWRTGYIKSLVVGRIWLERHNLVGDGQADKKHHGGLDQALLAYSADHYDEWNAELGIALPPGAFGENFTINGLSEDSVCIGDIYAVGEARIQVTQPRQPCANIARRWNNPQLTKRVEQSGRTGWYLRVLQEGYVEAGLPLALLERPFPKWTITNTHKVIRNRHSNPASAHELLAVPALGARAREILAHLRPVAANP